MSWVEVKYIGLVSSRLERFKRIDQSSYNFRCPYCGDSRKKKSKARGYLIERNGRWSYYCHNCNFSTSFSKFLEYLDHGLYRDYVLETFGKPSEKAVELAIEKAVGPAPIFKKDIGIKKISSMSPSHMAVQYVWKRKIPTKFHSELFYCQDFFSWVNKMLPGKFDDALKPEPRLVIPFLDKNDRLFGFQGRSFKEDAFARYITIILDEKMPPVYGLNRVDTSKTIYSFEGAFDSMFIDNSIAVSGSNMISNLKKLKLPKENLVLVYDNEPRNKEIVAKYDKAINAGYSICFWPERFPAKDVNKYIEDGGTAEYVKHIIDENTYSNLQAVAKLSEWRKV